MKRLFLTALAALLFSCSAYAQQPYSYNFINKGTNGPGVSFASTGITSFSLAWFPQTTVASCSVQVDSSSDGVTWGNGDLIASQSCTTVGSAAAATLASGKNFVRVNVTALTGNGGLNVTLTGVGGSGGGGSIGAATNVKTIGAVGNGKFFVDGVSNGGNSQLTSATTTFSASDVAQNITCVSAPFSGSVNLRINTTVASFVNSSTITYTGAAVGVFTGMYCALTNPADPAAILSAFNNCKSTFGTPQQGTQFQNVACNIYLPAGVYGIGNTLNNLISTGSEGCVGIIGDGQNKSILIPTGNFINAGIANGGFLINGRCAGHFYKDFSVEMAGIPFNLPNQEYVISVSGANSFVENVAIFDHCNSGVGTFYGLGSQSGSNQIWIHPEVVSSGGCPGTNGGMQLNNVSQSNINSPFLSNTSQNLQINNAVSGSGGAGIVIYGRVIDEGSITSVTNSVDVWLNGTTLTGGANCLSVDATSFIWLTGGYCGTFGAGVGGGPTVASGGVLNMTQVHVQANGASSACYTSAAYGGIVDDGTNKCTLVSSGTVYPAGGIINKTSLSHAQANAFQTGTLAVTTNLMSFAVDQPIAVQTLSWTPNNAFACTAGSFPTFSVSDGTVTATTSVNDTSASGTVTHTFPNTTASILNPAGTAGTIITVKVVTTGTCGTAPTNTQVNVWWQATAPGV